MTLDRLLDPEFLGIVSPELERVQTGLAPSRTVCVRSLNDLRVPQLRDDLARQLQDSPNPLWRLGGSSAGSRTGSSYLVRSAARRSPT